MLIHGGIIILFSILFVSFQNCSGPGTKTLANNSLSESSQTALPLGSSSADTQILFNDKGTVAGNAAFYFDKTTPSAILVNTLTGANNLVQFQSSLATSGSGDSGAIRGFAAATSGSTSSLRPVESQMSIHSGATANAFGLEVGLHNEVATSGNGIDPIGIYLYSSHAGWLPTGVRNETGLYIDGADGWKNGIRYRDTDGTTILFNVDQTGAISSAASGAVLADTGSTTANKYINFSNKGGSLYIGVENNTGSSILGNSEPYSSTIGTSGNNSFNIATNNSIKLKINGSGAVNLAAYSGTGNAYACFDSNGNLFRSNTPCN